MGILLDKGRRINDTGGYTNGSTEGKKRITI